MRFFRILWGGLRVIQTLVFGSLALLILVVVIGAISLQQTPEVPDGGALVLDPVGVLVEQKSALEPEDLLRGGEPPKEVLVRDLVEALALAKEDERIVVLILELDAFEGGLLPKVERVSRAIADFRESGKKVVAFGDQFSQPALLLAVQADEVILNPEGLALPEGFSMYRTYYKTLLENFEVSVNLFKVGKYKSAAEPFFRDDMSDEDREARLAMLDTWWNAYTTSIESARGLTSGSINQLIHDAPNQFRQAGGDPARFSMEAGLVDQLMAADEQRAYRIELAGKDEDTGEFKNIGFSDYLKVAREPVTHKDNKIAVITAVGSIVDGQAKAGTIGSSSLTELIREAHKDDAVKAIVLRVDSGGGSKTASEIIRRELAYVQQEGTPVVVSMGSVAASGGYWISATADEIWASPTTLTGSIGIFGLIPTFENTLARYGVNSDGVSTTPLAGGASLERGVSPFYGEIVQAVVEAGYSQFLTTVSKGRGMTTDEVHEIAQGRIWSGIKALELGLVDKLGDIDEAIEAAAKLAEVEEYSVWYVEPEVSGQEAILRELLTAVSGFSQRNDPVTQWVNHMKREFDFLGQLNDPHGAYVICAACPVNP